MTPNCPEANAILSYYSNIYPNGHYFFYIKRNTFYQWVYHFYWREASRCGRFARMAEGQVQQQTQQHYHNNRYHRRGKANGAGARPAKAFSDRGAQSLNVLLSENLEACRHDSEPEQLWVRRSHHQQQWKVTVAGINGANLASSHR